MVNYRALRQQLGREGNRQSYLLIGEEEYLKEKACLEIARAFLRERYSSDAVRTIYASEVEGPGIVEQCLNLGLFHQRQVLIVREADALTSKGRKAIVGYLEHPSPDTCLILSSFKLDEKSPLVKDCENRALVVSIDALEADELIDWILSSANKRGLVMDRQAAETLVSISGESLGLLENELEKLSLYQSPGQKVDREAVKRLAGLSSKASSEDLAFAVSRGDRKGALTLLQQLFDVGEDPARLINALFYQMEHLWKVKLASESHRPQGTIDRRTYWGLKKPGIQSLSRKRSDTQYLEAMLALFEGEHRIKSGSGDPKHMANQVVHRLTMN